MTVGEIAQHFTCSNATLTFHLRILRHAGLVQSTRKGRYLTYTIITRKLERIHNWISRYEFSGR